jgi:hypothetical protein
MAVRRDKLDIRLSRRFRGGEAFSVEPDRSKQQTRRFPVASIEQALGKMTKSETRNPKQVRMTKSENAL